MLTVTESGLYCAAGDFYIDPWRGVPRALITHAHSDHARRGSMAYLCVDSCAGLLRSRLGPVNIQTHPYGEQITIGGVKVSFHPAGHVLGSAQIRMEHQGEIWVASGDYKVAADRTCAAFEPVKCHTFLTESTFGLPVYRWRPAPEITAEIREWWRTNREEGRTSVMFAYSLGKAQRVLGSLEPEDGPIFVHGAVQEMLPHYAAAGITLPECLPATKENVRAAKGTGFVITPPGTDGSAWLASLGDVSTGCASGWMALRGTRRWRSADRGFALSDHADWPGLIGAIRATGAERVLVTHGYSATLARWLNENGWQAEVVPTRFTGDRAEPEEAAEDRESATPAEAEPSEA